MGLAVMASPLPAQRATTATVAGTVTLLDRARGGRDDLATAIVYLQGGTPDVGADTLPARASIVMQGREFLPHAVVVRAGGSVAFPNADPFSHNVFSNSDALRFDLGLYRRGQSRSATFATPGAHPVYCNIHAKMVAYVIAAPTPYVARIARDGRFTIANVPAGTWRLHVWHERAAPVAQEVVVDAAGANVQVTLDARGHVAAAHRNKFGLPYATTRTDRYE
jgi:plastocyanin